MYGVQILDSAGGNIVEYLKPAYVLDYFFIPANTSGEKSYPFDTSLFKMKWSSSLGYINSSVNLAITITGQTIKWNVKGYSFDIFIFIETV